MEFEYNKLRGRIVEKYGTQKNFARKIGLSNRTVSLKMNNKVDISREDIVKWSSEDTLDIPVDQIGEFYFTLKVK